MQQPTEQWYRKLSSAVWLGPDHVLYLKRQLFSQRLKRFDYGDIQALLLRQTRSHVHTLIALLAMAGLASLLIFAGIAGGAPWWGLLILALPTLGILTLALVHWRLGPTCTCHLRTAVQMEELKSLRRLRTARPLFQRLRMEIARVQGSDVATPAPGEDGTTWRALQSEPGGPEAARPVLERRMPQRRDYSGWAHGLLFGAIFLSALVSAVALAHLDRLVFSVGLASEILVLGSLVAALVMQHTRDTSGGLRIMGWGCTAYLIIGSVLSGAFAPEEFFDFLFITGEMNVWEHEGFATYVLASMIVELLLATAGFLMLLQFRNQNRRVLGPPAVHEVPPVTEEPLELSEEERD